MVHPNQIANTASLLVPGVLLAALVGTIGWQVGVFTPPSPSIAVGVARPETVSIAPRPYSYRATGAYQTAAGTPIDAPMVAVEPTGDLEVTTYQVSVGDYQRCVTDEACKPLRGRPAPPTHPVTGVSYDDATAYAQWLTEATGTTWRLPTVAEWVRAAGEKAVDPALGVDGSADNPADIWIAYYEREALLGSAGERQPGPAGSGGTNSFGVADLVGPVWEWTQTCDSRTTVAEDGEVLTHVESCGVRLLEGQHRTPMSAFIRDARTGGCSTGRPPDALGFRLVREPGFWERLFGG